MCAVFRAYVSYNLCYFILSGEKEDTMAEELDRAVADYKCLAFADSTKQSYKTHLKRYMIFCKEMDISPAPITVINLTRYAAYLASRLSFASVGKYLNIVRIIHRELGLPNPLDDNYSLNMVLKGIRRAKGDLVHRKLPITPTILLKIRLGLNLTKPHDTLFWAACLVAFFGLFRKSNLAPKSSASFHKDKHFVVGDLNKCNLGLSLSVKWTKTIQCKERQFTVPLPFLPHHPLCPVTALMSLLLLHGRVDEKAPLFSLGTATSVLTQSAFVNKLHHTLTSVGLDASNYSGHSFRRGGASWAFEVGLPGEVIQSMGDWKSHAYLAYLEFDLNTKFKWLDRFTTSLPNL